MLTESYAGPEVAFLETEPSRDPEFGDIASYCDVSVAGLCNAASCKCGCDSIGLCGRGGEADYWKLAYTRLGQTAKRQGKTVPLFGQAMRLIDLWQIEAKAFDLDSNKMLRQSCVSGPRRKELNRKFYLATRDFYRADGFPGSVLQRNMRFHFDERKSGRLRPNMPAPGSPIRLVVALCALLNDVAGGVA